MDGEGERHLFGGRPVLGFAQASTNHVVELGIGVDARLEEGVLGAFKYLFDLSILSIIRCTQGAIVRKTKRTTGAGMNRSLTSAWTTMSPRVRIVFEPGSEEAPRHAAMPQLPTKSIRLRFDELGGCPNRRCRPVYSFESTESRTIEGLRSRIPRCSRCPSACTRSSEVDRRNTRR